jgi:Ca2+-binding RTX toxin-like protein
MDALPYAAPTEPKGGFNKRMIAIVAIASVAVVAMAGGAVALTRDKGPSKATFIATADALCRPANGPITAIVKPTSYPELATAAGTVVTTSTGQMTQLNALKKPHGADGKAALPTLAAITATNTAAKALQDAATKKDDAATIAATKQLSAQTTDAVNQAKAYGLAACAVGMQPGIDNVAGGSQSVIKAGFLAKADSLCRASARKTDAIREPGNSIQDVVRYFNQNLDVFNALTNDLKALPVAPGDEATVTEMVGAAEKLTGKLAEIRDATQGSDLARLQALDKETGPLGTAADAKFDAYGLGVCGSNFGDA